MTNPNLGRGPNVDGVPTGYFKQWSNRTRPYRSLLETASQSASFMNPLAMEIRRFAPAHGSWR